MSFTLWYYRWTMILETLQQAAASPGVNATDGLLDVRLRPLAILRIKQRR